MLKSSRKRSSIIRIIRAIIFERFCYYFSFAVLSRIWTKQTNKQTHKQTKLYDKLRTNKNQTCKHDLCTADWYYYLVSPFHSLLLDNWIKTKILQRKQFESVQYFWRLDLKTYVNSTDTLFWFRNMFELIGT